LVVLTDKKVSEPRTWLERSKVPVFVACPEIRRIPDALFYGWLSFACFLFHCSPWKQPTSVEILPFSDRLRQKTTTRYIQATGSQPSQRRAGSKKDGFTLKKA
jgi:hypothetical protein